MRFDPNTRKKISIWEFGKFFKNIFQIMAKCMDKHYLPSFPPNIIWEIYAQMGPLVF